MILSHMVDLQCKDGECCNTSEDKMGGFCNTSEDKVAGICNTSEDKGRNLGVK